MKNKNYIVEHIKNLLKKNSGEKYPALLPKNLTLQNLAQTKIVVKPWGFELWLSEAKDTPYAFKVIYIKKGTKTSLQFHKKKKEHNFVLAGKIKLYYAVAKLRKIASLTLGSGYLLKILPPAVHRFEALTDTILIEVSTRHLDDVVRIADDYQRPGGRIALEHKLGKPR